MMKKNLFLSLSILAIVSCGKNSSKSTLSASSSGRDKIVGGSALTETSVMSKHIVFFAQETSRDQVDQYTFTINSVTCTGVLIEPKIVMTAAHCFSGTGPITIYGGLSAFTGSENTTRGFVKHASYPTQLNSALQESYDIALVFLDNAMTDGHTPIKMSNVVPAVGTPLVVAGYGQHHYPSFAPASGDATPSSGDATVAETQELKSIDLAGATIQGIANSEFAVRQALTSGIGHGDSGGPVMVRNGNDVELVGITSRMINFVGDAFPRFTIFTKVANFQAWVAQQKQQFEASHPVITNVNQAAGGQ